MLTLQAKDLFFDSPRVRKSVDAATRRVLSRQGAFVRRRARTDVLRRSEAKGTRATVRRVRGGVVRKVQKTARPGAPPIVRSRDRNATLRNILFAYSPTTRTVVIGPVWLNARPPSSSRQTVPELMEKGGSAGVFQWRPPGSTVWSVGRLRSRRSGTQTRVARGQYAAHPFMGPALEKEVAAGTIAGEWGGSVQ